MIRDHRRRFPGVDRHRLALHPRHTFASDSLMPRQDSLPVELLAEIFLLCLPSEISKPPSPTAAPLLVAQICRRWRSIALDLPPLWASFCATYNPVRGALFAKMPAAWANGLGDLWLQRAKNHPLSLTLLEFPPREVAALLHRCPNVESLRVDLTAP